MESKFKECPCGSGQLYAECCEPFHLGKEVTDPTQLVRARYSAYALNHPAYIIATTHPANPFYTANHRLWEEKISEFARQVSFQKVEILDSKIWGEVATVVFSAFLEEKGQNMSFIEKSVFEKRKGIWLYRHGLIKEGLNPNLMTIHETRVLPLAYYGEAVLRKKAEPIQEITDELKTLIEEMIETMDTSDGAGLAAPQVHHSIRLFVMRVPEEPGADPQRVGQVEVFMNPKLSLPSEDLIKADEGCLSIPTFRGAVRRPKEITVDYTNLQGEKITRRVKNWEARVIMHETDHLNGVLYIDRMDPQEKSKLEPHLKRLEERLHQKEVM